MSGSAVVGRRRERKAEVLGQPKGRRVEGGGGLTDRDPVELPHGDHVSLLVLGGDAVPYEEVVVRQVHDVAKHVLVGPVGVEHSIAVQVLRIELAVAPGAAAAEVAPGKERDGIGRGLDRRAGASSTGPAPTSVIWSGRSPRMPMSSTSALKMPMSVRSVLRTPWPTYWRPLKTVSAPLTVKLSGAIASASSLTVPISITSRSPAESAGAPTGWNSQNSRKSSRLRSSPWS